eukprot:CAMPEP_0176505014 /NCGR_PEP_ID=MMETSP0200_2-20121128/16260_1 /TAXON_ID=947934 /ORGANISM="Chaetoceros sp., Strain GSL56" /LENGTH=490 /DNA_ID=CAMNT_0017904523 /DNA_START=2380 /DNA_END=3852 /DNA_ORIENTATION=+
MLSGIKTGKRKRKLHEKQSSSTSEAKDRGASTITNNTSTTTASSYSANYNAAQELRRMLSSQFEPTSSVSCTNPISTSANSIVSDVNLPSEAQGHRVYRALNGLTSQPIHEEQDDTLVVTTWTSSSNQQQPTLQKEDFKRGAKKGKVNTKESFFHADQDKTIQDLVQEEKHLQLLAQSAKRAGSGSGGMDEMYTRNIARLGSRYKASEFKVMAGSSAGADEEDMAGDGGIDMTMFTSNERRLTDAAKQNREMSKQMALAQKEQKVTSLCWWWMESSSFQKHRLLSLGDYVSLVFVPSHLALVEFQCYLVPIKHSESFACCEDEVWDEVTRFRTCLRNMFAKEGKGVLFCETVLPTKGLWQARMDVIPVPKTVQEDAEIFFKSALAEQSEEWGTHNKILSTRGKGLRRTIPKGFPYFNVEWDDGGYAQIIETNTFPKDFGIDTIAGMMDVNPLRFDRKPKAVDHDRGKILEFVKHWKEFDWTLSLDDKETF